MRRSMVVLAVLGAVAAGRARAVEVADGRLGIYGYGGWAAGFTDGNRFRVGADEGRYDNTAFAVVLSARPAENVVIAGDVALWDDEVALEWAFAEYRFSDLLRVRAGKVKQPMGSSFELEDVGTARPFFELPVSIYGPANIGSEAYQGVGIAGTWARESGWALGWDAYFGNLSVDVYEPFDALRPGADPNAPIEEEERSNVRNISGGRLSLESPWGLTVRVSGTAGSVYTDESGDQEAMYVVGGLSVEYATERLELRTEAFRTSEDGGESSLAGYVQAAYRVTPRWQLAARAERSRTDAVGVASSPLLRHDEAALGVNCWVNPNLVFRVSYHHVRGARFAAPADETASPLDVVARTNLVVVGTQFSF